MLQGPPGPRFGGGRAASLVNIAFETAGSDTGVLVSYNGTAWKVAGTNSIVTA